MFHHLQYHQYKTTIWWLKGWHTQNFDLKHLAQKFSPNNLFSKICQPRAYPAITSSLILQDYCFLYLDQWAAQFEWGGVAFWWGCGGGPVNNYFQSKLVARLRFCLLVRMWKRKLECEQRLNNCPLTPKPIPTTTITSPPTNTIICWWNNSLNIYHPHCGHVSDERDVTVQANGLREKEMESNEEPGKQYRELRPLRAAWQVATDFNWRACNRLPANASPHNCFDQRLQPSFVTVWCRCTIW